MVKRAKVRADQNATRERLLAAGHAEFALHGFEGARIERIVRRARCNIRMLYHYFGNKEQFYITVLEDTYRQLREQEETIDFRFIDPGEGMRQLIEVTFDYVLSHPNYARMLMNENLLRGRFLRRSKKVSQSTPSRISVIRDLLLRGEKSGAFRGGIDPVQLFVTILSVCYVHVSNRYTLSILFQQDLADPAWLAERRKHVLDLVISYLSASDRSAPLACG